MFWGLYADWYDLCLYEFSLKMNPFSRRLSHIGFVHMKLYVCTSQCDLTQNAIEASSSIDITPMKH